MEKARARIGAYFEKDDEERPWEKVDTGVSARLIACLRHVERNEPREMAVVHKARLLVRWDQTQNRRSLLFCALNEAGGSCLVARVEPEPGQTFLSARKATKPKRKIFELKGFDIFVFFLEKELNNKNY